MRLGPSGKSRPLQLDGLIGTQEGEVFAQIESHEDTQMNITLPLTSSRSPLWCVQFSMVYLPWNLL